MTRHSFEIRLLATLGLTGCSLTSTEVATPAVTPDPVPPTVPAPDPDPAVPTLAPASLSVENPRVWGSVSFALSEIPEHDAKIYILAAEGLGSTPVDGVVTKLATPRIVAVLDRTGSAMSGTGPHQSAERIGEMLYFQAISADGAWSSEVASTAVVALEPTCGESVMAYQFPTGWESGERVIACNTDFVVGMCPVVDPGVNGQAVLMAAGADVANGFGVGAGCLEVAATGACCYSFPVTVQVDTGWGGGDSGAWWVDTGGGGGGGGGGGWGGRPFRVEGQMRVADVVHTDLDAELLQCPPEIREALVVSWCAMGLEEHASVAAFARFTMELMSVGAPIAFVQQASAAQVDEVRHTQMAFDIASRFAGHQIQPTALTMDGALDARDLRAITLDVVREGCINETVSTLVVLEARDGCESPAIRDVLSQIAEDEGRHAELAWAFVRWAVQQPGAESLKDEVLAELQAFDPAVTTPEAPNAEALATYGILSTHRRERVRRRARHLIATCAEALA